jgi:hypothetical protein
VTNPQPPARRLAPARLLAPFLLLALAACGAPAAQSRIEAKQTAQDPPELWRVESFDAWQVYHFRFNAVDELKLDPYLTVFGEWRPRPGLSVRAELGNLTDRGYRRVTLTYPGPKNGGLVPTLTERETYLGHEFSLRVRKSFGG